MMLTDQVRREPNQFISESTRTDPQIVSRKQKLYMPTFPLKAIAILA